jgi:hypothetical protein
VGFVCWFGLVCLLVSVGRAAGVLACLGRQHGGRAGGLVWQGSRQHRRQEHGSMGSCTLTVESPISKETG